MAVRLIRPKVPPSCDTLAKNLRRLIREGDVSAFAVAIVHRDGRMSGEWTDAPNAPALLGAIDRLSYRFNANLDGTTE